MNKKPIVTQNKVEQLIERQPPSFKIDLRRSKYAKLGLMDMCRYLEKEMELTKIVEVGSFSGVSMYIFSKFFKEVISIDPWVSNYDPNDDASNPKKFNMGDVEAHFDRMVERVKTPITKMKMKSEEAVIQFKDESLPVVYIDALHTYPGVKKDSKLWFPKIQKGGFICFHDFSNGKHHPGVGKAVLEIFGKPERVFMDTSCVIRVK